MMNRYPVRALGEALYEDAEMISLNPKKQYSITGIYSFGRGLIKRPDILGSETAYERMAQLKARQVVMSKLNAWEGALAVVDNVFNGTYVSPEYPVFSIDESVADTAYIRHLLKWPTLWSLLKPRGSMVRRKRTSPTTLLATDVPLPDLDEQRRVAAKLDASTDRISRIIALRDKASVLGQQYMDALLQPVEERARLSSFLHPSSDFIDVDPIATYRTAGILNRGRGLFERPLITGDETKYPRYNRLRTGQFVYSKLFGWEGSLAVVPPSFEGVHVSHEFPTFDIDPDVADLEYVTHLARWHGLHNSLKDQGTGMGSRRQRVNIDRLLAAEVPLPSLPEQRRIARGLTLVHQTSLAGAEQSTQLAALRPALLNAAFSGQL
jgi:type I restriction enzyme S subunit